MENEKLKIENGSPIHRFQFSIFNFQFTAAAAVLLALAIPAQAASVHEWRLAHEQEIVGELMQLLAIPNVASDREDIERNAQAIVALFAKRGIEARLLRVEGAPPLIVADVRAPKAKVTIAFYAHYDGQP